MPELPEVETTCRGIAPHILNQTVSKIIIRTPKLRWPIPKKIASILPGQVVLAVERRAKYLLLKFNTGTLIIHLGMSGRLQILFTNVPPQKHDHVDIVFSTDLCLRYTDPRRFGAMLWTEDEPFEHKLLRELGPEPFFKQFTADYLINVAGKRSVPIKNFIMDSKVVVGVGNIYASEALFAAGIDPRTPAYKVSAEHFTALVKHIKVILKQAIKQGGTTLKDFRDSSGKPGYFSQKLRVYGRSGQPCFTCQQPIQSIVLGQRNTFYCADCQA